MTTTSNQPQDRLLDSYQAARTLWPFIRTAEGSHELPDCLLFGVGWVETGLTNVVGDQGHGHGVWQLDDRSHRIPAGFDQSVPTQCVTAAVMLSDLLHWSGGRLPRALAAYNAGQGAVTAALARGADPDSVTTGGHYAALVIDATRRCHLQHLADRAATSLAMTRAFYRRPSSAP